MTIDQPTAAPTRKMWAVIVATFVVHGLLAILDIFVPGLAAALPASEWIAALVPILAGYATRDRAK